MLTRRTMLAGIPLISVASVPVHIATPQERLQAATLAVRSAIRDLGITEYVVMIQEEAQGHAKLVIVDGPMLNIVT